MLLPQAGLDAEALRVEYRAARALFDELNARGHAARHPVDGHVGRL